MNWFYVDRGEQAGPVTDEQFTQLLQSGKITADTLVWREGLQEWIPHRTAMAQLNPPPPIVSPPVPPIVSDAGAKEVVCAECRKTFPASETIRFGYASVCSACKPVYLQRLSEGAPTRLNLNRPPTAIEGAEYAGFWIRFAAKIIDILIIGVPLGLILFALIFPSISHPETITPFLQILQMSVQFGFLLINLGYQIFFLGKYGATLGKMACKIKVVTAEGEKISYGRATGRAFAEILSGMVCYIGYIIAGFDEEKRALHDHICSTRVIYK